MVIGNNMFYLKKKKTFSVEAKSYFLTTFQAIEKKQHDSVIDLTKEVLSDCNTGKGFFFFKKVGKGNNSKYI